MKKSNITQSSSFSFLMPLFVAMGLLAISVTSCKTTKKTNVPDQQVELKKQDHETSEDSTEYELIIMDSRFPFNTEIFIRLALIMTKTQIMVWS
jgi:hypothetical protein